MKKYAYIRVSSKDQNIARQVEAMESIGILEQNMFIDKQSGKNFYREQYQLLLINAEDKTIYVGDEFDPLKDVTATDKEDGNITLTIENVKK